MNTTSDALTTLATPFGTTPSGAALFSVQPGVLVHEALGQLATNLGNIAVLCDEACDADIKPTRAMNQVIAQMIESSRGLLAAALEGINQSERDRQE